MLLDTVTLKVTIHYNDTYVMLIPSIYMHLGQIHEEANVCIYGRAIDKTAVTCVQSIHSNLAEVAHTILGGEYSS